METHHSPVEIPLLGNPSPPITTSRRRIWIAATATALLCLGPILVVLFHSGDGNRGIGFRSTGGPDIVESEVGVVAADDWRCSNIGVSALRAGGHAVDAAVAAALCLGIVHPMSSGIGGGAFMVAWLSGSSSADTYDSRETAPAAASETGEHDQGGKGNGRLLAQHNYPPQQQPQQPHDQKSNLEAIMEKNMACTESTMQTLEASIKNLETQLGQLDNVLTGWQYGTHPSNTETNLKEQAHMTSKLAPAFEGSSIIPCTINNTSTQVLCDRGSSRNLISLQNVKFHIEPVAEERVSLILVDVKNVITEGAAMNVEITMGEETVSTKFQVMGPKNNDSLLVVGAPFFKAVNATLLLAEGLVRNFDNSHK